MPEPIHEETEENWLTFMNRFEQEIYPSIFAKYGLSKETALLSWQLQGIAAGIDNLEEKLDQRSF